MELFVLGINHRVASVSLRERCALGAERLEEFLQNATRLPHVEELLVLNTCNRVELYGVSRHPHQAAKNLREYWLNFCQKQKEVGTPELSETSLQDSFYLYVGEPSVSHGFRVASSLDSMIVGEAQILGQVKEAYRQAQAASTTGRVLNKYFHHVFQVAKRVRSETGIAQHPVSVSYAAMVLAQQIFGDLQKKKVLVLGAGKMSQLALKHLQSAGVAHFYVTNRTEERAQAIAQALGGEAIPFANFEKWLADVDLVISSTNSSRYLIDASMVQTALKNRKGGPIFFIDLAVPRDIAPDVNELSGVFLYDVDDLGAVVAANKSTRSQEAKAAEAIVVQEVENFSGVLKNLALGPTISTLRRKLERITEQELEKVFSQLPHLNVEEREVIRQMSTSLVKKVLHEPTVRLKEEHAQSDHHDYASMLRRLFRLDEI